jgi:hypothetical protein
MKRSKSNANNEFMRKYTTIQITDCFRSFPRQTKFYASIWPAVCGRQFLEPSVPLEFDNVKVQIFPVNSSEYKPDTEYASNWESLQEFTYEFYVHVSQVKHYSSHCSNAEYAVLVTPSIHI